MAMRCKAGFFPLLSIVLSLFACGQSDSTLQTADRTIGFGSLEVTTRGTTTTLSTLTNFGVFGFYTAASSWTGTTEVPDLFTNTIVQKSSGNWTYSPIRYWPATPGAKLSFFAYSPHSSTSALVEAAPQYLSGVPLINFTVPVDIANHVDLLVAAPKLDQASVAAPSPVELVFSHALTKVTFSAMLKEDLSAGMSVQVSKIEIGDLFSQGTLMLDNTSTAWTNHTTPLLYELTTDPDGGLNSVNLVKDVPQTISDAASEVMLLPQMFIDDSAQFIITFKVTDHLGFVTEKIQGISVRHVMLATPPFQAKWSAGQSINFKISFSLFSIPSISGAIFTWGAPKPGGSGTIII